MGQFGGWGKFGGGFQFGGSEPYAQIFYRVLKRLGPPGLRPNDDEALTNILLRADCAGLGDGQIVADRLLAEIFPHTAAEDLPEWEDLLKIVPAQGATIADRQDAAVSRWRGAAGCSLPELRAMLYPLLKPSWAWYDDFSSGLVLPQWDTAGQGQVTIASNRMRVEAVNGTGCQLDGDLEDGELATKRLHDINDGWTLIGQINNATINLATAAGLIAFRDYDNFYCLELTNKGAGVRLTVTKVVAGVQTEDVDTVNIAAPSLPEYLQITRAGTTLTFSYGDSATALTDLHSFNEEFVCRHVGMFARNSDVTKLQGFADWENVKLTHATPVNNVQILEKTTAIIGSAEEWQIFHAFVHRDPADTENGYDVANAKRQMDRAAQGHTLITVGESAAFKTNDPYSLTNRDILGGS